MDKRRIEYIPLGKLKTAKRNPKLHDKASINKSINRFGYTEPIVIDERTGLMVAGHGRVEALFEMRKAGANCPDGVEFVEGDWSIPVVRGWSSRSDEDAEAYIIASNQLTMAGGYDDKVLAEMISELAAKNLMDGVGFDDKAITRLLDKFTRPGEGDPNEVPPTPDASAVWVKLGDMFEVGDHRIICGDSTDPAVVDKVMGGEKADICWTDPPWNVAYDGKASIHKGAAEQHAPIANDNLGKEFPAFCAKVAGQIQRVTKPGGVLYMAMSASEWPTIDGSLRAVGFHWSSTIIWAKESFVIGRRDYHSQYEPIWYGWLEGAARLMELADRTQSDLWNIPRPKVSDEHPTMKPIELITKSLANSSIRGSVVFEPFSGSGSTLMAAEQTGRKCRAVELECRYVQVALERWTKLTGRTFKQL